MNRKFGQFIIAILSIIIGALAAVAGIMCLQEIYDPWTDNSSYCLMMLVIVIFIYLALFIQVIIHECGHMIFGLLSGYQFLSIRIGPFMLLKENDQIHLKLYSVTGTAGQCLLICPELKDGRLPYFFYHAGGCLLNIITAIPFILIALHLSQHAYWQCFLWCLGISGVGSALMNGIPLKTTAINNDGWNILLLKKYPQAHLAVYIQMKVNEYLCRGYRIKDLPDRLFAAPEDKDLSIELCFFQAMLLENRALDQHDDDLTMQWIDRLLAIPHISPVFEHSLINDAIYIHLLHQEYDQAQALMTKKHLKYRKTLQRNSSFLRTQYAYEKLITHNEKKAARCLKTFEKTAKNHPYAGDIISERELIERLDIQL